jgi:hypothetical protein
MLLKNISGQLIYFFAIDTTTIPYSPKLSDAANITGHYALDGIDHSGFGTAHPNEMALGVYSQPLTQGETNCNIYAYSWASSTAGVVIHPIIGFTSGVNLPAVAFNAANGLPIVSAAGPIAIDSSGRLVLQPSGLDAIVDDSYNLRQAIYIIASMVGGTISGLPTSPATVKSLDGANTRAVVSFDSNNNRTSVTLTPPT